MQDDNNTNQTQPASEPMAEQKCSKCTRATMGGNCAGCTMPQEQCMCQPAPEEEPQNPAAAPTQAPTAPAQPGSTPEVPTPGDTNGGQGMGGM